MSLDLYYYLFDYHAVMNTFIQQQETLSDTHSTYTPPCFPSIELNMSLLPHGQGSLTSIPNNALIFTETQTFENDATTTKNYLDTQTVDFCWFLPFSIVFIVFVWMAENHMKTIRKRCLDAIQSLRFH